MARKYPPKPQPDGAPDYIPDFSMFDELDDGGPEEECTDGLAEEGDFSEDDFAAADRAWSKIAARKAADEGADEEEGVDLGPDIPAGDGPVAGQEEARGVAGG